jgi:transposase-like protein
LSTLSGQIEMDETMFGGKAPGKRGWGASGKHMVFGLYQRNGKVLKFPIASRGIRKLIPLMTQHTKAGSDSQVMSITNRYVKRSRISESKFRELVRYFSLDLDARKIAFLTRLTDICS